MSNQDEWDHFADVMYGKDAGIFSSHDSLRFHDNIRWDLNQTGVAIEMPCRGCGATRRVTVPWPEVVALRCSISPHVAYQGTPFASSASPWRLANKRVLEYEGQEYWVPDGLACRCGAEIAPMFTPDECAVLLKKAVTKRLLDPQLEQQLGSLCMTKRKNLGG